MGGGRYSRCAPGGEKLTAGLSCCFGSEKHCGVRRGDQVGRRFLQNWSAGALESSCQRPMARHSDYVHVEACSIALQHILDSIRVCWALLCGLPLFRQAMRRRHADKTAQWARTDD